LTLGNQTAFANLIVELVENQDGTITARLVRRQSLMVEAQSTQRQSVHEENFERVLDEIMQQFLM
jgi:hypothetical protein